MSITPQNTETTYALAGANLGPFSTVWFYETADDVQAWLNIGEAPVQLTNGVDYTLTGVTPTVSGGTVLLSNVYLVAGVWPANSQLVLARKTSVDQPSSFGSGLGFSQLAAEQALDHVAREVQDLATAQGRALSAPIGDSSDMTLPSAAARANLFAAYDGLGNPIAALAALDGNPVTPYAAGLLSSATIAAARAQLGMSSISIFDYIPAALQPAIRNGTTTADVTAYIQAALDANPGAAFEFDGLFLLTQTLVCYTGQKFFTRKSATFKADVANWVGVNTGGVFTSSMFKNANFSAVNITDSDIGFFGLTFDYNGLNVANGGTECIFMRRVERVIVSDCTFFGRGGGNDATAFLGCRDTIVDGCYAEDFINAYFDHWDSANSAIVTNCTGRNNPGVDIEQGILFTGDGLLTPGGASSVILVSGNKLFRVRNSVSKAAAAIGFGAIAAGASVGRPMSVGNYIENSDIGLVFSGNVFGGTSIGDVMYLTNGLPIFFQPAASGVPSNCRVINPHLIDCSHLPGNAAMIGVSGVSNSVTGIMVSLSAAPTYASIAWATATASATLFDIAVAPTGSSSRILDQGTSTVWSDRDPATGNTVNSHGFQVGATQVIGARRPGWTVDTGTAKRTANATYSDTAGAAYSQTQLQTAMNALRDLSQTVKALKDDMFGHGLIGA